MPSTVGRGCGWCARWRISTSGEVKTVASDSWTVAPQQTLPDGEYQRLREAAFACARAVGVATGGANVQFAYEPGTRELVLIEMNPRVSRSSALASKATGFPIAKVAATDTTLTTTNAAGERVTVPIPKGSGIALHVPGLHFNREPMLRSKVINRSLTPSIGFVSAL